MSLQLCVFPHRCMSCGSTWTHSTTHSPSGEWVNSTEPQYTSDKISHLVLFKEVKDRFCFKCIARHTPGITFYDHNASQPPQPTNRYSEASLEDLLK